MRHCRKEPESTVGYFIENDDSDDDKNDLFGRKAKVLINKRITKTKKK